MIPTTCRRLLLAVAAVATLLAAGGVRAQEPDTAAARRAAEQRLGRPISTDQILQRIQESGLSRAEARERLRQMGYDPSLVDAYYDALEEGAALPAEPPPDDFARALEGLKRAPRVDLTRVDTLEPGEPARADTAREPADSTGLPLFGRELFSDVTTEFQPVLYGPVDADYRLGPGDEVLLVLTGGVEAAYALEVNRQGYIAIPDVGQLPVNGMTLDALDTALRQYMGRVYSGLRGESPSIQLQVSLGRLRTNQVYIVGEVERPGAYQVSAVATVFNALYRAGGPTRSGSFREARVWRGGEVVRTIDLYDYLITGDSRDDIRLEHGDRIHVPLTGPRAAVRGEVRRPAVYELLPGETLTDLLRFAGGFEPEAVVRRIQIDRILPPGQRRPGVDRVLVDVDLEQLLEEREPVPIRDGDAVRVFAVSADRRHRVALTGAVRRPGTYEWAPRLTLGELLDRADGVQESAYTERAHIFRLNEETGERRLVSVPLPAAGSDGAVSVPLVDRDSVVVYSREELDTPERVTVAGYVKSPGTYRLAEGMTLDDLILTAGGFREGAYTAGAEVARMSASGARTDTTAEVLNVARGSDFRLRPDDRVYVRQDPGYTQPRTVSVGGEVQFPGEYVLSRRTERLAEVLERAGGLTSDAHVPGIRIVRDGKLVAVDAEEALDDPDSPLNLVLESGDSLQVPTYDPTVLVLGAVAFESRVLYRPGESLDYYVQQAGGYGEVADRDRTTVTYQNGERATASTMLLFRRTPTVTPGSTIHVPAVPVQERIGINWADVLSRTVSLASVTATLLLAISQL